MINHSTTRFSQRGVTLIEVLVTAVVISVGLLGIAALHLRSLQNSYDSNSRSKAIWLADYIEDKMRANRTEAITTTDYIIAVNAAPSGSTLAASDLQEWKALLASTLPNGDGSISTVTTGSDTVFTVTIQWAERGNATTAFISQTEI